jgi:hypothetical protein
MEASGQLHASAVLPEGAPGIHWIGGRMGPRAGLDTESQNMTTLQGSQAKCEASR